MPSPFPGMNPYLEQDDAWHDFHQSFIPAVREVLSVLVAPRYIVKIDDHAYIHELSAEERRPLGRPDVFITPTGAGGGLAVPGAAVLDAPVPLVLPAIDVERQAYLEVRDRQSRQIVTVIELLSPSNKDPGPDRDQYLGKRNAVLASGTSLVEIDLLRRAGRLPPVDLPGSDYCVFVCRTWQRPRAGAWPICLRDRLPVIPIPLRAGEPEPRIDLQALLDRVYDAAGYQHYIYTGTPRPPLSAEDAAWARQYVPATAP